MPEVTQNEEGQKQKLKVVLNAANHVSTLEELFPELNPLPDYYDELLPLGQYCRFFLRQSAFHFLSLLITVLHTEIIR